MGLNPILALQTALVRALRRVRGGLVGVAVCHPPRAAHRYLSRHGCRRTELASRLALARSPTSSTRSGIGSFATTTAIFRALRIVPDRFIPGTLNVGHTLPTVVQALIYTTIVKVDVLTLFALIAAAVLGAWLGAGVGRRRGRGRRCRSGWGPRCSARRVLMFMTQMSMFPGGGDALGVRGVKLGIGVGVNFILGALMSLGIGLYAPCMILVSLLGMNPTAAFPIMMGSCAFLMPVGSLRFIRERCYGLRAALGLAIGGIPGVLLAAFIVKYDAHLRRPLAGHRRRGLHRRHDAEGWPHPGQSGHRWPLN